MPTINYPSVETLLVGWLGSVLGVKVKTELPADVSGLVPVIRLVRVGGSDVDLTVDRATVDVEVFDLTRAKAFSLAEQVRMALRTQLPGSRFSGGTVQSVHTISAPSWRPWDDLNVRRVGASYEVTLHTST